MVRIWRNYINYILLLGKESGTSNLENSWQFLKKKKEEICNCHVTSNYTPGHLFQKNENLGFRKHLHTNVYGSFICIIILKKKREREKTTQMSFNMWLIKQTVVHPTMENYSAIRRSELLQSFNNNYELS